MTSFGAQIENQDQFMRNRTAFISTCVEWDREQRYKTIDLLLYVTDQDTGTKGI